MDDTFASQKEAASKCFRELRDVIVEAFERVEDSHFEGPLSELSPGRFELTETRRESGDGSAAGGGLMSVMRGGRVFEKVGVNVSTVFGTLGSKALEAMAARRNLAGLAEDPQFWASGISLVAHMQNPHVPAVHLNTRMFWTPQAWWFGGGSDLNPCIEYAEDTQAFHSVLKECCDQHGEDNYPKYKAWADDYFFVRHRDRTRGVGGIFFDDRNTGDWNADFEFTKDVGCAFLDAYLPLIDRRRTQIWSEEDKEKQLIHRGLYAEYNLVYDRGTKFGLESGHDADAVLMSLPPTAKWH